MEILHVTKDNFSHILAQHETVVLDFWASWCVPCRMLAPTFEELSRERPEVAFGKVDVDQEPELAAQFRVMSIPCLAFIKNGETVKQTVGVQPKEVLLALVDSL